MKKYGQGIKNAAGGLNRPEEEMEGGEWRIERELVSEEMALDDQELWDVARGSNMMNAENESRKAVRTFIRCAMGPFSPIAGIWVSEGFNRDWLEGGEPKWDTQWLEILEVVTEKGHPPKSVWNFSTTARDGTNCSWRRRAG